MKHFYSFLTIILLCQLSISAQQTDSARTTLNEIVVTATKTETPYYAIGSSVSVITSKEIHERQLKTVVDVLREEPGLSIVEQGGPGKLAYVFMRGSNTNHTLVIVDGVTMNDASSPNNAFDFSTLNTNDVDRIEIVRGPQSTLYGSDAIAGIVNIITKQGTNKPQYSFSVEGGSNNYYRGNLSALGSYGKLHYAINATQNGSAGVSVADSRYGNTEKDDYSNTSFTSNLGYDLFLNTKLNIIYKYTKAKADLDQFDENWIFFRDDPNYTYNSEEQLFKGSVSLSLFEGKWQQQLNSSLIKKNSSTLDLVDFIRPNTSSDSYNKSQRIKFDWQNNLQFIKNHKVIFGIETSTESATTSSNSSIFGASAFPEQSIRTTGFYLQDQISVANSLFTSIGLRYDYNQKFGGVATFRIASAYFFSTTGTKLKMSYGSGFKAPSLFYLFDPMFGNPDLQPEKSKGWDIGIDQNFADGKYNFSVTYFDLKLENMFGFDSNFRTINIAEASSNGFEFSASAINIQHFSLNASYTHTVTKDEYRLSPDFDKPLLRRPKNQASIVANYRMNDRTNFNLQLRYVGERDDKDFSTYSASRVTLSDYTLVNLSASYKLFNYLELTARIENLFDKQYEEVLYYGTLGRSFYVGMNLGL